MSSTDMSLQRYTHKTLDIVIPLINGRLMKNVYLLPYEKDLVYEFCFTVAKAIESTNPRYGMSEKIMNKYNIRELCYLDGENIVNFFCCVLFDLGVLR